MAALKKRVLTLGNTDSARRKNASVTRPREMGSVAGEKYMGGVSRWKEVGKKKKRTWCGLNFGCLRGTGGFLITSAQTCGGRES